MLRDDDPSIESLEPAARVLVGEIWSRRAASELEVGARFTSIGDELLSHPAAAGTHALVLRAAADERRHAELCAQVAGRYTHVHVAPPAAQAKPLVRFGDADDELSLLLHLVLISCISEVTSTFYLRAAMQGARSQLARSSLRQLLADDVRHARIGWTHLRSAFVSTAQKAHVARALPTLLRLSAEALDGIPERAEPCFVDHGCPGRTTALEAFKSALSGVILPGMAHVAIDPSRAAHWAAERCLV